VLAGRVYDRELRRLTGEAPPVLPLFLSRPPPAGPVVIQQDHVRDLDGDGRAELVYGHAIFTWTATGWAPASFFAPPSPLSHPSLTYANPKESHMHASCDATTSRHRTSHVSRGAICAPPKPSTYLRALNGMLGDASPPRSQANRFDAWIAASLGCAYLPASARARLRLAAGAVLPPFSRPTAS
jgi:hypothetical protein